MKAQAAEFIKTGKMQLLEEYAGGNQYLTGYDQHAGTAETTCLRGNGVVSIAKWVCISSVWINYPCAIIGWEIESTKTERK